MLHFMDSRRFSTLQRWQLCTSYSFSECYDLLYLASTNFDGIWEFILVRFTTLIWVLYMFSDLAHAKNSTCMHAINGVLNY